MTEIEKLEKQLARLGSCIDALQASVYIHGIILVIVGVMLGIGILVA